MKKVVVPGIFLAALSSPLFMEEAHAASNIKYVEVNKGSVLNVRVGPSENTNIVTTLNAGAKVNVLSETKGWSKVDVNGKTGYVSSTYLTTKQVSSIKYVSINPSSTLNVRETASTKANVVTKLKNNTKVEVVSESNGWAKIKVNGKDGYVASEYIKAEQTEEKKTTNITNQQKKVTKYVNVNTGSSLNLRNSPSNSGSIIVKLAKDVPVTVYSESNGWSKVEVYGKQGYVATQYLAAEKSTSSTSNTKKPSTSTSKDTSVKTTAKYVNVAKNSSLNVRKEANTNSSIVSKLSRGTKVTVLSSANGWDKVTVSGKTGYVSSTYLSDKQITDNASSNKVTDKDSGQSNTDKSPAVTMKKVNVQTGSNLNVRSTASTSGAIKGKLTAGTVVTVLSEKNGWSQIKTDKIEGYVSSEYLTSISSPEKGTDQTGKTEEKQPEKTPTVEKKVNVQAGSSLNVRSTASTSGAIKGKLTAGTVVTVLSEKNGWSQIKTNKVEGYVSSKYLTSISSPEKGTDQTGKTEENQPEKTPTVEKKVNVQAGSSLNVRSTASTSGAIKGKLTAGTVVTVLSEKNGWSQIKTDKVEGYVSSEYLTSISSPEKGTDQTEETKPEETPAVIEKIVNVQAGSSLNMRSTPSTSGTIVSKLPAGTVVIVQSEENGWSKVKVNNLEGYVSTEYLSAKGNGTTNATINKSYVNYNLTIEDMTDIQLSVNPQTDKKYDTYIREDAIAFKTADSTKATVLGNGWRLRGGAGTDYSVVSTLTSGQVLTIVSKVKGTDGYYWYKVDYSQAWVSASKEDTAYYLNPNNFINSDTQSLQFLKLSAKANVDDEEVDKKILAGKGILAGKASAFVTAANAYGVNELYLISHALLETGNGTSTLANGVEINGKKVYNMYGIGAYDGSAISSGAQYAYNAGWFTPEAAIIGGAKFIAQGYVNAGQDTLYKMRWNPDAAEKTGTATHQYASDIGWATKQVNQIYNLYSLISSYTLNYEIPTYQVISK
ncbi:SH3 domain-containing protein [Niallia sp.]|uniref:SH3 domain-containing protein n=1 Tax=Niallia sp. TaxID=2837523 RepID=UPI00289D3E95|nr:SH3 domain-containing protein [Niallia sp.]